MSNFSNRMINVSPAKVLKNVQTTKGNCLFFSLGVVKVRSLGLSYEQFPIVKRAIFYHSNNSLPI